jgi:hypothetical protein
VSNERKRDPSLFIGLFIAFMGVASLTNAASKPEFEAIQSVVVVQLIAAGMCFGAAIFTLVKFVRGRRST